MEENNRKGFLEELIKNVNKAIELEKELDKKLQEIKEKGAKGKPIGRTSITKGVF